MSRRRIKNTRSPARSLPPEIEEQVKANLADQRHRARVRNELRGSYGAWALGPEETASLLESEAQILRANAEADRRRSRGGK